jgi:flagellin-like protein
MGIKKVFVLMSQFRNEEAVSPVIGVILMVAITVILAAVIAAFVFGMAGNIQQTKVVSVTTYRPNTTAVAFTFQGGQDAGTLEQIMFTVNDSAITPANTFGKAGEIMPVGSGGSIVADAVGKNHIVGVAHFSDGSTQVIVDKTL